ECRDAQDQAIDARHAVEPPPLERRRDERIQCGLLGTDAREDLLGEGARGFAGLAVEIVGDLVPVAREIVARFQTADFSAIQQLERRLAAARSLGPASRRVRRHWPRAKARAMSMTARAASRPLFEGPSTAR